MVLPMSNDASQKIVGLKSPKALSRELGVPEQVLLRECADLLLLPVEQAIYTMRQPRPASPRQSGRKKAASV